MSTLGYAKRQIRTLGEKKENRVRRARSHRGTSAPFIGGTRHFCEADFPAHSQKFDNKRCVTRTKRAKFRCKTRRSDERYGNR